MASYNCLYPEAPLFEGDTSIEWDDVEWAEEGAFADAEHDDPAERERRFYSIAVRRGWASDVGVGSIAVLGVTRDLSLGIETRYRAERDGDEWTLSEHEGIPPSVCALPDRESEIPPTRRERFRRVLERAHGVDGSRAVPEDATFERAGELRADGGESTGKLVEVFRRETVIETNDGIAIGERAAEEVDGDE